MVMVKVPPGTRRVNRDGQHPPREWTILYSAAGKGEVDVGFTERRGKSWRAFPSDGTGWSDFARWVDAVEWLVDSYKGRAATSEESAAEEEQLVTKTGKVITQEDIQAWAEPVPAAFLRSPEVPEDAELPGMWESADFIGGQTDMPTREELTREMGDWVREAEAQSQENPLAGLDWLATPAEPGPARVDPRVPDDEPPF